MDFFKLADKVLQGETITREECLQIIDCPEDMLLELLHAGFHIRKNCFGRKVSLHLLVNAKSGLCPEDCAYCSQSAVSEASIEKYPLLDEESIRFLNPQTEIRVAGGREYHLRSLQPMALYPANSLFVNGYLTTPGQTAKQTREMIQDLGFEVEEERSMEIAARLG